MTRKVDQINNINKKRALAALFLYIRNKNLNHQKMKLYQILALTALTIFSCSSGDKTSDTSENDTGMTEVQNPEVHKRVSLEEFNKIIENEEVQLVDVRTPGEYAGGFIDDAINIDFMGDGFVDNCTAKLDKNKPMAIYCAAGGRSAKALEQLKAAGFKEVYELGVGYNGYIK